MQNVLISKVYFLLLACGLSPISAVSQEAQSSTQSQAKNTIVGTVVHPYKLDTWGHV